MLFKMNLCNVFNLILYLLGKCIYFIAIHVEVIQIFFFFTLNVNFIVFIHWMLTLYMYSLKLYLLMS